MSGKIYVGDYGMPIEYTVSSGLASTDLDAATTLQFRITKPDKTVLTKTCTSTGLVISYTVESDIHTLPGQYDVQPYTVIGTVRKYLDKASYLVEPL